MLSITQEYIQNMIDTSFSKHSDSNVIDSISLDMNSSDSLTSKIREIIRDEQDSISRKNNIVIYRLDENEETDSEKIKVMLKRINENLDVQSISKVSRLGKKVNESNRPLLVTFDSYSEKVKLMTSLSKMKDLGLNISISKLLGYWSDFVDTNTLNFFRLKAKN